MPTMAPRPDDLDIVRRINVFRGLNPRMIQQMVAPATTLSLRAHQVVCRQDDPATAFFIVVDGWIKLYRITIAGDEAVINVLAKGDSFAESAAFTGQSYLHTAEAVSDARVIRVPVAHVVKCIQSTPEFAQAMIAAMAQHMSHLVHQVEQLKAKLGVQRLAEFLVSLGPSGEGSCTVALPYDKTLIAGRLGLKPESLSRAFAKLRSVGVHVHAAYVEVKNLDKLRRFAADDRGSARNSLHARASGDCAG
jgi:CRP/FNR family transcriptional regulator, dissimilatory nitrate respiration regulator